MNRPFIDSFQMVKTQLLTFRETTTGTAPSRPRLFACSPALQTLQSKCPLFGFKRSEMLGPIAVAAGRFSRLCNCLAERFGRQA